MFAFLKLIRIQNLFIIVFTQYIVRWCLLYPMLKLSDLDFQLSNFHFFLLVLSTVMIASAGYIINDYFDVNIDKINKPERLVIDKGVKRRVAIGAHTVINFLAISIGLYVSIVAGSWKLVLIHLFWTAGLWFYSTHFKRQFFIGNIIIAVFVALVPLVVGIYDLLPIYKFYSGIVDIGQIKIIWMYVMGISFFAFITTLIREIIKDIEDVDGDKEYGCRTMPIVIGKTYTKYIVIAITLFTMICLAFMQVKQFTAKDWPTFIYFCIALQLPFCFLTYKMAISKNKNDYRFAGNTTKVIMLLGISYLFLFAHTVLNYINAI